MNPRPGWQRAFDVQVGLWRRWNRTDVEGFIQERAVARLDPNQPITKGDEQWERALREAVAAARRTVFHADPFFVSVDMCDLIQVASETLKLEPLLQSDLLSPCGFLLFEKPIDLWTGEPGDQFLHHYAGFSWIGIERQEGTGPFAVALTTYIHWDPNRPGRDGLPDVQDFEMWTFDAAPATSRIAWWRLAQTTLRLMLEFKPASRYKAQPDRASRRAASRSGFKERDVTVVRLRRERSLSDRLGGIANYSCRFMVSGHWRNQWCPALGRHRQTWIAPYVKGPDDKPFKPTSGRAFMFTR